ncbi:MAG: hypothetical protein WCV67_15655 [Victivallaceae bacterium]
MAQNKGKSKSSSFTGFIARMLLVITGVLLVFIIVLAFAVLGSHPEFKPGNINSNQVRLQSLILNRILADIMKSQSGDTSRIELSEEEVNSILTMLENGSKLADFFSSNDRRRAQIQPQQNYKLIFKNKKLIIDIAVDTKFNNPIGSYIWLNIHGTPEITEKDAWLNVQSASAGAVPLPKDITATVIRMLLDKVKDEEYYKIAREIIVKANVTPEGKLLLVYRPNTLRRLVFKNFFQ